MDATDASETIRRATADDLATLTGLVGEYWAFEGIDGFDGHRVQPVLARFLADPRLGAAWIVESKAGAAGYLAACYVYSIEHGGLTAEIDELFVRPAHRGAGLGRRMLGIAEGEFARAGCTNVALQLGRANADARAFYERCGYRARSRYELLDKMLTGVPGARG